MFYAARSSGKLRLGDVVSGYVTAIPRQDEPIKDSFVGYDIDVKLDPASCCAYPLLLN